jgi:hypothetical protein
MAFIGVVMNKSTETVLSRFEKLYTKIPIAGCWIWHGALKNKFGHGAFKLGNRKSKVMFSHRASWELYVGKIPEYKCVLHRCDNPACVNPHHLFLGSKKDNTDDMIKKGRNNFGLKCKNSKINDEIALKIKTSDNKNAIHLSSIFGISRQAVTDIIYGRTWKHV